jgi:hypothetical protein
MLSAWIHLGREWDIVALRPDYVIGAVWELGALLGDASPP